MGIIGTQGSQDDGLQGNQFCEIAGRKNLYS